MNNPNLIKSFVAEAAITKFRIVKFGASDDNVLTNAAVSDKSIGVTTDIDAAINDRVDVVVSGISDVEYGGTVTRGDKLTSDATGKALAAAPSAGVNNHIIGIAMVSGVSGDIGAVNVAVSVMQG